MLPKDVLAVHEICDEHKAVVLMKDRGYIIDIGTGERYPSGGF